MNTQKVTFVQKCQDQQVYIRVMNLQTGIEKWFSWEKYPGELPKLGEEW